MARIAVLLPCFNEERAVEGTVAAFRAALPDATIYVYDNGSTDQTAACAAKAGAVVKREPLRGKGNVVRRMFADVDAEVFVLADGDATYDAGAAPAMIARLVDDQLDMVVGKRVASDGAAYRRGHRFGNHALTGFLAWLFGQRFTDVLSGYRVFSRRFVKSFPALSSGFEIETELTVHALTLKLPVAEVDVPYGARPSGSASKLSTYKDGANIAWVIVNLFKDERPLSFFGAIWLALAALSIVLALPVFQTYLETGLVPRFPTAILCASIMALAFLSLVCGLVLDTVARGRREVRRRGDLQCGPPRMD